MGLFSSKKKVTVDDFSKTIMVAAIEAVGRVECFNDVDDGKSLAVNMGYFMGYIQLQLSTITKLDLVDEVMSKTLRNIDEATKGSVSIENFGYTVRSIANNAIANMKYTSKETDNPFMGMAVFYMCDLFNSTTLNIDLVDTAEKNMRLLYGMAGAIVKDIKIVK